MIFLKIKSFERVSTGAKMARNLLDNWRELSLKELSNATFRSFIILKPISPVSLQMTRRMLPFYFTITYIHRLLSTTRAFAHRAPWFLLGIDWLMHIIWRLNIRLIFSISLVIREESHYHLVLESTGSPILNSMYFSNIAIQLNWLLLYLTKPSVSVSFQLAGFKPVCVFCPSQAICQIYATDDLYLWSVVIPKSLLVYYIIDLCLLWTLW